MIAPVAVGLGKTTVKLPAVDVLSPPKSMIATDRDWETIKKKPT